MSLDLYFRNRCCGKDDLRVGSVYPRPGRADKCERNHVVSRIAVLEMGTSIIGVRGYPLMLMDGQSVVMLRMIMIVVNVSV
jgi:hypothetical protein